MDKIVIAGIGTDVGKTVVAAVMATMVQGDYWKPIQSGSENPDTQVLTHLLDPSKHQIFPPTYTFKAPLSPHHAARLENTSIHIQKIVPPQTKRPLIIEMVGGIFAPLNRRVLSIDLFNSWEAGWVIVSKHYLGSINHTLLTIEALKNRKAQLLGIVFNGEPNPDSEEAILEISALPLLGRLLPEKQITPSIIKRYARKWKQ